MRLQKVLALGKYCGKDWVANTQQERAEGAASEGATPSGVPATQTVPLLQRDSLQSQERSTGVQLQCLVKFCGLQPFQALGEMSSYSSCSSEDFAETAATSMVMPNVKYQFLEGTQHPMVAAIQLGVCHLTGLLVLVLVVRELLNLKSRCNLSVGLTNNLK